MLVLMCRAGQHRLALDHREVVEVVPCVELRSIPNAPGWLSGVFVYRGRVLTVLDLTQMATGQTCPIRWSTRIIVVNHPGQKDRCLGLLAEHVTTAVIDDHLLQRDVAVDVSQLGSESQAWQWGAVRLDDDGMFQILDLVNLLTPDRQAMLRLCGT